MLARAQVLEQAGGLVHIHDDDLLPPVAIDISHRQTARGPRLLKGRASLAGNVLKASVAQVPIQQCLLQVAVAHRRIVDLGIDVPVGQHDILPAVVVDVYKSDPPPQQLVLAQPHLLRNIVEEQASLVLVERGQVSREVRLRDIQKAVAVVIGHRHAHAGLQTAIVVVSHARIHAALFERPVAAIVIQQTGCHVASHIDVRPAIVVEIGSHNAQSISPARFENARLLGDVGKGAVPIVVEQGVPAFRQTAGTAHHRQPLPDAIGIGAGSRRGAQVQIHVVGNEEVHVAVAVVIQESAARAPAGARHRQFGLGGYVGKLPVAQIAIENVVAVVGDQHVGPTVVVIVGHADALSPAFLRDARLARHFGEVAISVVVVQLRSDVGRTAECRAIHDEDIIAPIAIEVEDRHARAGGFQNVVFLLHAAESIRNIETGGLGDVHEMDLHRWAAYQEKGACEHRQGEEKSKHLTYFTLAHGPSGRRGHPRL